MNVMDPFVLQRAESGAAESVLARLRAEAGPETPTAGAESPAPAMLARCLEYAPELERLYRVFGRDGAAWAAPALGSVLKEFTGLCDHRLSIINGVEEFFRPRGLVDDAQARRLAATRDDIAAVRRLAEGFLTWLDTPPPPLTAEERAATAAAYERGDYEPIEDVLRRVESGGAL